MDLFILVVDDEERVSKTLVRLFEARGLRSRAVSTPDEAIAAIEAGRVGVVLQDMNFGAAHTDGRQGQLLFREIHARKPELPVMLMTAWTSLETAVSLVREGAADYVAKPWDNDKLISTIRTLLELSRVRIDNARLREAAAATRAGLAARYDLAGLVYASAQLHEVVSLACHVARSDAPVFISGPSGAGKEALAELIQRNSRVADGPFVRVNVGALPDELMVAELFGAEPGAYTGAARQREGRFEAADGGTLFLDEIGNLSARGQAALLRVLQTGEFERLGSSKTRRVRTRLVAAANTDMAQAIADGRFREDLYYRLNVIELHVPPLAARRDDVIPLAEHFLAIHGDGHDLRFSTLALDALRAHTWPGNVRELQNRVRRGAIVCRDGIVGEQELGFIRGDVSPHAPAAPSRASDEPALDVDDDGEVVDAAERSRVEDALARHRGVVARAADDLGLSRQALYRRMSKLGLGIERRVRIG